MDGCLTDPKTTFLKARASWELASAQQLEKATADSDGMNMHSANYVDEVLEYCDGRHALDEFPNVPIARPIANCALIYYFWAIQSPCVRWLSFRSALF